MTDLFQYVYWLQAHEWLFWIVVNLSAYFGYWLSRYTIAGILGIVFPMASATCTILMASEWWMGGIGIATIVIMSAPFFIILPKDSRKKSTSPRP